MLDASASFDPDQPAATATALDFVWQCASVNSTLVITCANVVVPNTATNGPQLRLAGTLPLWSALGQVWCMNHDCFAFQIIFLNSQTHPPSSPSARSTRQPPPRSSPCSHPRAD